MYYMVKQELDTEETRQNVFLEHTVPGPVSIECSFSLNGFFIVKAKTIDEAEHEVFKRKLMMALFSKELGLEVPYLSSAAQEHILNPLKAQIDEKLKSNDTHIQLKLNVPEIEEIKWGINVRVPLERIGVHNLNATLDIDYSYIQNLDYVSISEEEFAVIEKHFGTTSKHCLLLDTRRLFIDGVMYEFDLTIREVKNEGV